MAWYFWMLCSLQKALVHLHTWKTISATQKPLYHKRSLLSASKLKAKGHYVTCTLHVPEMDNLISFDGSCLLMHLSDPGELQEVEFFGVPRRSSQLTTCKHQIKKRIRFLSCKSRDTWAVSHRDTWCPVKENTLVISARHRLCGKHVESTNQRQEMTAWYTNVTSLNKEITLHSRNRSTRDFVTRFQLWVKVTSAMK